MGLAGLYYELGILPACQRQVDCEWEFGLPLLISIRNTEMNDKEMFSSSLPVIKDISQETSGAPGDSIPAGWIDGLQKIWLYLKGEHEEKTNIPDPAASIILQIADKEVAGIVRDLHYRTPKSLETMRKACESCFVLPDDCPYYDYSIFDVKKALRRLVDQPRHTHKQVIAELRKINRELAYHLSEGLE